MYFSKLRLAGFKSFVESTEMPIAPGLTGVVGPNGCGKSNLVEALRWVMGENRAKQMRGGEMDDVIFAGTTSRPARNLAEVALLIDNGQRKAPAAYNDQTEFEVVRRIERGQGSAYRIAGRETRARDVQLLFADAATGAHSPALVSQGRIGAIIQGKPTERRALLEEAAGISGLHSRRHEAELKLKAAEANLARLDDVLTTLDTQHQALKKQAKQAARYRNMSALIRRAEAISLHLAWTTGTANRDAAAARFAAAEAAVAEVATRAAEAATVLANAQSTLPDLRKVEAEAAARLTRLGLAREQLDAEEARVQQALQALEARLQQLTADIDRERVQASDAEAALARLAQEQTEIDAADAAADDVRKDIEAQLNSARADVEALDAELSRATEAVAKAEAERVTVAREIGELAARAQRLEERLAETRAEREKLEAAVSDFDPQVQAADQKVTDGEAALTTAQQASTELETQLRAAQDRENAARDALRTAEAELARIDAEASALANVLKTTKNAEGQLPVLDQISVVPGYEKALGTALGDDLAATLSTDAMMHWRVVGPIEAPPLLPAGIEPLSRFVKAPPALARRLSQIGVVETASEGAEGARHLLQGQRLVSRDGALWRWDGYTIRAGAASAAAARMEQRNRLDELNGLRTGVAEKTDAARVEFTTAQDTARTAQTQDREARETAQRLHKELSQSRDARSSLARQAAAETARLAGMTEQLERLTQDFADQTARHTAATERLEALPDTTAAREKLVEDRAELGRRRTRLSECESARDNLAREATARGRRRNEITSESHAWTGRLDAARRQLELLAERQTQTTEERDRLAARPGEIAQERNALIDKLNEAETERRAAADRLAEAETLVADADRSLKAVESEHGAAREERVRCEGVVQQNEHDLEELTHRIRERLDVAPEETLTLAEIDPGDELPSAEQINGRLERLIRERDTMGPVNLRAEQESEEIEQQITGMTAEKDDLVAAIARLRQGINSLNREGRERLLAAFETVNKNFQELFVKLFGGGRAHLALAHPPAKESAATNPDGTPIEAAETAPRYEDPLEAGLEVYASPPGKKLQNLSLLSGGEQALTALSLLFAVFICNPAPICVLDEVDAPLDDANVDRFCTLLEHIASTTGTRFIVVTHHRLTMAKMDRLFGVTMAERGVSQLVSVDLRAAERMRATA